MSVVTSGLRGVHRVELVVADPAATAAFYGAETTLLPVDGAAAGTTLLRGPNTHVELHTATAEAAVETPVEGPGITHVCFQSPAEDGLFRRFIDRGATTVTRGGATVDLAGAGVTYGYARDTDGLMFEVEQLDRPHFDGPFWIAHVAFATPDIDRLVDFYSALIGKEPYRRVNKVMGPPVDEVTDLDGARMRAAWIDVGNMVLEFWQFISPPTPATRIERAEGSPGFGAVVFEVDDLDAEVERLASLGVAVSVDAAPGHFGRQASAADPDGNQLRFVEIDDPQHSLERLARREVD